MGPRKTTSLIKGAWRIVEMESWDQEALDLVAPAYIEFGSDGLGRMQFIALEAFIDYRVAQEAGQTKVEFTWEGHDDGDPVNGRAWAVLREDRLEGGLFIHRGDESSFVAERRT